MASFQRPNSQPFHWINKDSESNQLSRSDGLEAASILKFVQKNRKAVRRARRSHTRKGAHDFVAFRTGSVNAAARLTRSAEDGEPDEASVFQAAQSRWRLNIPVNNVTEGSGVDPFATSIIPITSDIFSLLQYAKAAMIRGAYGYKLEVLPRELRPMTHMYQKATDYVFENVLKFKYIIYPFLAAFTQHLRALNGKSFPSLHEPDWYLHLATQAVRKALIEKIDDRSALGCISTGVCWLVCATGVMYRCEDSRIHTQAFMKFLPYLDTKSVVGYWKIDTVGVLDLLRCTAVGKEPVLKIAPSDPGPLPLSKKALMQEKLVQLQQSEFRSVSPTRVDSANSYRTEPSNSAYDLMQNPTEDLVFRLGSAFDDALMAGRLHPAIYRPVENLMECLMVAKLVWRAPEHLTKRDTQWLCRRSQAVLHELLSLKDSRKLSLSTPSGRFAEGFRAALVIVMTSVLYRVLRMSREWQSSRLRTVLVQVMHDRINFKTPRFEVGNESTDEDESTDYTVTRESDESLLWMLFTGYWAAAGFPLESWFAESIIYLATRCLQIGRFHELEDVMLRHLYSKTVQRNSLANIAALISREKLTTRVPNSATNCRVHRDISIRLIPTL